MYKTFEITIPNSIPEAGFSDYLISASELYNAALDQSANPYDPYSQVEALRITKVEISGESVMIEYAVHISAFHACHDRSFNDIETRRISARLCNRKVTFLEYQAPEERSPGDEL